MRVLLVEDDGDQASEITALLKSEFRRLAVEEVSTEYDLVQKIPQLLKKPPDVIVLDVMLRRTPLVQGQDIDFPLDPDIGPDAGFRCAKKLREAGSNVPIILYSVLDERDVEDHLRTVPPNVFYARKEYEWASLTDRIKQVMQR